jgi:hypothetical protein
MVKSIDERKEPGRKRNRPDAWDGSTKRAKPDDNDASSPNSADANTLPTKKQTKPFSGKLFAISTLSKGNFAKSAKASDGAADDTRDSTSYKRLLAVCQFGGAACTSQVHKKVFCLVATTTACDNATQRVRKAWKKGIPVVKDTWLHKCLSVGFMLPFADDRVMLPGIPSVLHDDRELAEVQTPTNYGCQSQGVDGNSQINIVTERVVYLGCCCICHETDSVVVDCVWCRTDCSVRQSQIKDSSYTI